MMILRVKDGKATIIEELVTLYNDTIKNNVAWNKSATLTAKEFEALIADEILYVASIDKEIVGFLTFYEPSFFIHLLFVKPKNQNKKIGKTFIEQVVSEYPKEVLSLKCLMHNQKAVLFYERNGFKIKKTVVSDVEEESYQLMVKEKS